MNGHLKPKKNHRRSSLPIFLAAFYCVRVLVHEPKLIVCDEPTSNLDHTTGRRMMELQRQVAKRPDRALIVQTPDPRIFEFADRTARMDDGRIMEVLEGLSKERSAMTKPIRKYLLPALAVLGVAAAAVMS